MAEKLEPHPDRNGEEAVEKVRRLWDEGIASGRGIPAEDFFREMKERYGSASEND